MTRDACARSLPGLLFGSLLVAGCTEEVSTYTEVDAQQLDGVWVFTFGEDPTLIMEALTGGPASVVDECLLVDDAVVVWYDMHLSSVEDVIGRVKDGEMLDIQNLGGGGMSLDEGSTTDEFPASIVEHCSPNAVWLSSPHDFTVTEGS